MAKESSFEDLEVWQAGMTLCETVYHLTAGFPRDEQFGLTSQIRRAAVSIPSNIAEGWGRGQGASNVNFARIARGSAYELATLLALVQRLRIADRESISLALDQLMSVRRLVGAYVKSMEQSCVRESSIAYSASGDQSSN